MDAILNPASDSMAMAAAVGMFTPEQAASQIPFAIGVDSLLMVNRLIARGSLASKRIGGAVRVTVDDLRNFLANAEMRAGARKAVGMPPETLQPFFTILPQGQSDWFDEKPWSGERDSLLWGLTRELEKQLPARMVVSNIVTGPGPSRWVWLYDENMNELARLTQIRDGTMSADRGVEKVQSSEDTNVFLKPKMTPEIQALLNASTLNPGGVWNANGVFKFPDASAFLNMGEMVATLALMSVTGQRMDRSGNKFGRLYASPDEYQRCVQDGLVAFKSMGPIGEATRILSPEAAQTNAMDPAQMGGHWPSPIIRVRIGFTPSEIMALAGSRVERLASLAF